jgi:hypothetical protein
LRSRNGNYRCWKRILRKQSIRCSEDGGFSDRAIHHQSIGRSAALNPGFGNVALFSQIAEQHLSLRKGGGADEAVISMARLRLDAFFELIGDRPLDQYLP